MRIWNEMMIREHPRGYGLLVGRQVRYLIESEYGWLGAMGFAAPALRMADRDDWIGWTVERRRASLHTVVPRAFILCMIQVKPNLPPAPLHRFP